MFKHAQGALLAEFAIGQPAFEEVGFERRIGGAELSEKPALLAELSVPTEGERARRMRLDTPKTVSGGTGQPFGSALLLDRYVMGQFDRRDGAWHIFRIGGSESVTAGDLIYGLGTVDHILGPRV